MKSTKKYIDLFMAMQWIVGYDLGLSLYKMTMAIIIVIELRKCISSNEII